MNFRRRSTVLLPAAGLRLNHSLAIRLGCLATWRAMPNGQLFWADFPKNFIKVVSTGSSRGTPTGEIALLNGSLTNAETSDYGITSGLWTFFCRMFIFAAPGNGEYPAVFGRSSYTNESTNSGWSFYIKAADGGPAKGITAAVQANNSGGSYNLDSGLTAADNTGYTLTHLTDGTNRYVYPNGLVDGTTTNAANLNPASTSGNMTFGMTMTTAAVGFIEGALFNRQLTPIEIRQLHFYGTLPFLFSDQSYFIPLAGAGGAAARSQVIIIG